MQRVLFLTWIVLAAVLVAGRAGAVQAQPPESEADVGDVELPPIVEESPLLLEPETAEELFDATVQMVRLARPNLARRYLEAFLETAPEDDLLLDLRERHGPAVFLQLANVPELRPLSTRLLDRVNAVFRDRAADPARVDALIQRLRGAPREREAALIALHNAGPVVVPRILQLLGDEETGDRDLLLHTLTRLGRNVVPPLLGALDAPGEHLRTMVIEALGWLGSPDEAAWLWYYAYGPEQPAGVRAAALGALARILRRPSERLEGAVPHGVAAELRQSALRHFRNEYPWRDDPLGEAIEDEAVPVWTWLPEAETVGAVPLSPYAASMYTGARLARQALALAPERRDLQALALGLALALDAERAGRDQPLPAGPSTAHDAGLTAGADVVLDALALSLANNNAAAAAGTLQVLSQVGRRHQLARRDGAPSPIMAALSFPDPLVQFAAATTVLQLEPESRLPGIDRVTAVLARALRNNGAACLVVDADAERGSSKAGLLSELGYEPLTARTGADGFKIAAARNDVELIALEINTLRPNLSQTVANLRADARTAYIPIVVYGPEAMRPRIEPLLARHPRIEYVIEATMSVDLLRTQLQRFLAGLRTPPLTEAQRSAQRAAAVYWLAHVANGRRIDVFDLAPATDALMTATEDPELAGNALAALGAIPNGAAQKSLHAVAVSPVKPAPARERAALQLAFHIQRFGLLLDRREVAEVERAWQSAAEPEVATALASVVGTLRPNGRRTDDRLRGLPSPTVPVR